MESVSIAQNNKTIMPNKPATPYNPCGSRELTTARASFTSILPPVGTSTAATSLGTWVSEQKKNPPSPNSPAKQAGLKQLKQQRWCVHQVGVGKLTLSVPQP